MQQDSSDLAPLLKIGLFSKILISTPSKKVFVWQNSLRLLSGKQEVVSSIPAWGIILFFSKNDFFQEVLWLSAKFSEVQNLENENLWLKLQFVFRCASRLLAASPRNFSYFYLIKMKNPPLSKPYFGLFLACRAH